jgi:hypothetical protein
MNKKYTHFENEIYGDVEPKHEAFGIFFTFVLSLVIIGILFLAIINIFHWQPFINGLI